MLSSIRTAIACLGFVAMSMTGGVSMGQDGGNKSPQEKFEPRSRPGIGQKFLERFVGEWTVTKTFYPASGRAARMEGSCTQSMVQGGRFLQSVFSFRDGAATTTGMGLIGFEPETGLFTSMWIDSRQTKMSLRQSREKFDGERIVLYAKNLTREDGGRVSRTETRLEDDGSRIVHRQYVGQAADSLRLIMELVLVRKNKAS
jgi:hypothetical protein